MQIFEDRCKYHNHDSIVRKIEITLHSLLENCSYYYIGNQVSLNKHKKETPSRTEIKETNVNLCVLIQ